MKQFQSIVEGTWVELKPVVLTEEQKTLLMSKEKGDKEAQLALFEEIQFQREGVVDAAKSAELAAFYESKKPELKAEDVFQLIAADVSESFNGIINFRVNGEHKQIRF
jgi:hypothetical protein